MPNFFSAFTTDVFRPLATLLIPGAVGVSTWFIALVWQFPSLRDIVTRNHTETGFTLLFATVFAGMVFEDFGARYEILLDWWADRRTSNEHRAIGGSICKRRSSQSRSEGVMRERLF